MSGDPATTSDSTMTVVSASERAGPRPRESVLLGPGEWVGGRYQIQSFLGRGGYAEVYRVTDTQREGRTLALKLHRWGHLDRRAISALRSEFGLLSTLTHPNLATVYDFAFRPQEYAFFTQTFIDGGPLSKASVDPTSGPGGLLLVQLCRALDYLHSRGVLHGDIKPGNVLVDRDRARLTLLDFGISRALGGGPEGLVMGSPSYMAPELITGSGVDARTDLYALGITLYQLVAGVVPFRGSRTDVLHQHLEAPIPDLAHDVPLTLRVLIARLLAKDPNERPASAALVLADIARVAGVAATVDTQETLASHLLSAPAVGRVSELFELSFKVEQARAGRPPVLLTGPAGAGKSRLVRELRRRVQLRGETWIQVHVRRGRDDALVRLARAVLDRQRREELDDEARIELARALPELRRENEQIAVPIDPVRASRRRVQRLGEVIEARFDADSGVLVIEDLHWASERELELLVTLLKGAQRARAGCLFLLVARPGSADALAAMFDAERMDCGPLSSRSAKALIEATLGDPAVLEGSALGERIDAAPSGALWLQESLRLALEAGAIVRRAGHFERVTEIEAASLADVLVARLKHVGATARRLALGLAVLDEPQLAGDLVRASGLRRARALEALGALVRSGIVERLTDAGPHARYAMHDRYAARILEIEPVSSVTATRGRVGRWLAGRKDVEFRDLARAATELSAAGQKSAAAAALSRAAVMAEESGRHEHAVSLLLRELELRQRDDPARPELLMRVYDLAMRCGLDERAGQALTSLRELSADKDDPGLAVKVGLRGAHRAFRKGDLECARVASEDALAAAHAGSHDIVACELEILSANIELRLGALDRSLSRAVEAAARADLLGRPELQANAQLVASLVHVNRREVAESNAAARRAVRAADRTRDPVLRSRALRSLGNAHLIASRRKLAIRSYRRAVREARESGGLESEAKALNNLAAVASSVGQISEALEAWKRSIVLKERVGAVASAMLTRASMGGAQLLFGDRAEARAAQQSILHTERLDARLAVAVAWSNRGDLEASERNFAASIDAYDRSSEGYSQLQMNSLRAHGLSGGVRARLARREQGDLEAAGVLLEELETIARSAPPAHARFLGTTRATYLDALGEPAQALTVAVEAARITSAETEYEDLFASPIEAAWLVAVLRRRLGRPTRQALARARRRLDKSVSRLEGQLREAFLSQHPLHVAIVAGELDPPLGTTW